MFYIVIYVSLIIKGAPKSVSFISVSAISLHILFICECCPMSINALLASSNHSFKRIRYQISRDQVDHDVSSRLLSRTGHQQKRRHLLTPKRSLDLPVLTPERSDNKFFSRKMIRRFQERVDPQGGTFTDE